MVKDIRQETQTTTQPTPAAAVKKHVADLSRLMDGANIPSVLHDRTRLKQIPRATRENLRQTAVALLAQIPQITRMYESVVMMLDQISVELEE